MKKWILSIPLFLMFSGISYCVPRSNSSGPVLPTPSKWLKIEEDKKKRAEEPCYLDVLVTERAHVWLKRYQSEVHFTISVSVNGKEVFPKRFREIPIYAYHCIPPEHLRDDTYAQYSIKKGSTVKIMATMEKPSLYPLPQPKGEIEFVIGKNTKVSMERKGQKLKFFVRVLKNPSSP